MGGCEADLRECLVARTIPPDTLTRAIAVAKIRAVETSIALCHALKQEVGSYALMWNTGFENTDFLQCCKFAEGDSRILSQKLARDAFNEFVKNKGKAPGGWSRAEAGSCRRVAKIVAPGPRRGWERWRRGTPRGSTSTRWRRRCAIGSWGRGRVGEEARARGCEGGIVVYGIQRMKLVERCKVRERQGWTFSQSGATFQRFLRRFSQEVDQVLVFRELLGNIQRCLSVFIGQNGVGSILQQKLADFYPLVTAQTYEV